jgi:EAL domain-containing protein (putative c-di-GMP-specific phosphodiesterase class I)/FixJ family two-component response regulator
MNDFGHDRINVLLVDDSSFARGVGQRVLRHAGIKSVLEARSGQEAIDLLDPPGRPVDVIFCDLMMPRLDGVQLVRRIALLDTPPAIVFLSGANAALLRTVEDTARARGLRVLGVIEKPLTADAVHRVLARLGDKLPSAGSDTSIQISPEDVEEALAREQFTLHFQPKVAMADDSVVGFESLARWFHPEKGMIPPSSFIPIAERSGQIGALTDRLTMLALEQSAAWAAVRLLTKISVNLSAYMLVDLDLPDRMASDAARFRIDPGRVILEITESGLLQDSANTLDILARLHMKGFPLSIDDFGTGYSSMEQLRRIPFAEMKIDRIFVNGASENPKARAILESSANLGRSLQMSVVAEGVETQEDWDAVRTAGVDIVQGYFVAKPMAAAQARAWLSHRVKAS